MSALEQTLQLAASNKVTLTLVVIGITILIWRFGGKRYKLPPGPTPLPIIGNLLDLRKATNLSQFFKNMEKKYGPVFRLRIGMIDTVVLNTLEVVQEALIQRPNDFAGRPKFYSVSLFPGASTAIAFGDLTPAWAAQRKIAHNAIRKYASGKDLEELIHYSMDIASEVLDEQHEPFDPKKLTTLLVFNVIAMMCFGKRFEFNDPFLKELIDTHDKTREASGHGMLPDFLPFLAPLWNILPLKSKAAMKSLSSKFLSLLEGSLAEHEKNYDPNYLTDLTYNIIHDMKRLEQNPDHAQLTKAHLTSLLEDFFVAGTGTTRFTLLWILQYLAAFPDIQEKAFREVERVVGQNQPVLLAHRSELPYCEAVLSEVLRMRPPANFGLPHRTTCDTQVGGYEIPAGFQVLLNFWAIQMDPEFWDDPEKFNPERFLDDEGCLLPKPDNYMPFSAGKRSCVGEVLAKAELHMFTALLVQKYSFHPAPGETLVGEMVNTGFGCFPTPYKIVVKPRS